MRNLILLLLIVFQASAFAQASMSPAQWRSDIAFLQSEIPNRYPDFYARYPKDAWERNLAGIAARVEGKSDLQIGLELQAVLARAKDAHLRFDLTQQLQTSKVIPVAFGQYQEGLFVSGTIQKFEKVLGRKVLKINGASPEEALQKIGYFLSLENDFGLQKDGPIWLRFPMVIRMAGISADDTLRLLLDTPGGLPETLSVYPIDFRSAGRMAISPAQFTPENPDLRWQPLSGLYRLEWLPDEKIVYFQYSFCAGSEIAAAHGDSMSAAQLPLMHPVFDSIYNLLATHEQARLLFDLRFTAGGLPDDGLALAQRIASNRKINQKNRIYITYNGYSGSAPIQIAEGFRMYTNATLIGEPSSEMTLHTGELGTLTLPASGLLVVYPRSFREPLNPSDRNSDALYPDVMMPMLFEAFKVGKDPVMDYIRKQH